MSAEFFRHEGETYLKISPVGGHGGGATSEAVKVATALDFVEHPIAYARFLATEVHDVVHTEIAPSQLVEPPAHEPEPEEADIEPSKEA